MPPKNIALINRDDLTGRNISKNFREGVLRQYSFMSAMNWREAESHFSRYFREILTPVFGTVVRCVRNPDITIGDRVIEPAADFTVYFENGTYMDVDVKLTSNRTHILTRQYQLNRVNSNWRDDSARSILSLRYNNNYRNFEKVRGVYIVYNRNSTINSIFVTYIN